jgi:hypothetical protein
MELLNLDFIKNKSKFLDLLPTGIALEEVNRAM